MQFLLTSKGLKTGVMLNIICLYLLLHTPLAYGGPASQTPVRALLLHLPTGTLSGGPCTPRRWLSTTQIFLATSLVYDAL